MGRNFNFNYKPGLAPAHIILEQFSWAQQS